LTVRLMHRLANASGTEKPIWLFLTSFVAASTIWTTHFLAMLGYLSGGPAGYEPMRTVASFIVAVLACGAGIGVSALGGRSMLVEVGGIILGLGIAAMHYLGMSAYQIHGFIEWERPQVIASLVLGAGFGMIATNRVGRPLTRFCRYGASLSLSLAIATTHFAGKDALTVVLSEQAAAPTEILPPVVMGASVIVLMFVLLTLVAATYLLDARSTQAAFERYRHLSLHDPLTGLANRIALREKLSSMEGAATDGSIRSAVLSFDLDRFKEINDVHGHAAGDAVLREIGARLAAVANRGEFIARVGGDEFVAILYNYFKRGDGMSFAKRLLAEICKPIEWKGNNLYVGSSVGIAVYPTDSRSADDLLAQADVAMYRAKHSGGETICFYDSSMDQAARERNALAIDMRTGLLDGQFELYYQQQNDTFSGEVVSFEALLRWNHPVRGLVSPADFIPIAERTGLIGELGEWVLRTACSEAATWKNPLGIAVNVAAQQLSDPMLPHRVRQILDETGLDPARLELEITETGIIADQGRALQVVRHLKSMGVKIAMDDYGTGYSSLSTLMTFPFDKIKIDRTFIDGLTPNSQSAAIVRSTLILADSLNIPVLAEGVETHAHIDFLRSEGCGQVQGYLFGRPGPKKGIEAIVNREPGSASEISCVA
jgi:diguanylate cyclase